MFLGLEIHSSITSQESVSSCGTDELCLRGHRLTMTWLKQNPPTEYEQTVICQSKFGGIRAKFQVAFDPKNHTVFWVPNGMLLQLKRHPSRQEAYVLLGECALTHYGSLPALVVHDCGRFFADFKPRFDLQDLRSLWELCMDVKSVSYLCRIRFWLSWLKVPDTIMGLETVGRVLSAYDSLDILSRSCTLEPDTQRLFDFLSFCQSEDTWRVLEKSRVSLATPVLRNIQDINELCLSWLQCYRKTETLIGQCSRETYEDVTWRVEFLEHLDAWEKTTETLSKELGWTKSFSWPFISPPGFYTWDHVEDDTSSPLKQLMRWAQSIIWTSEEPSEVDIWDRVKDKKAETKLVSVISNNFNGVRFRFNLPATATRSRHERINYILEPWGGEWTETIRSIPYLLAISSRLDSWDRLGLREKLLEHGAWRNEGLEIFPAETITVL